MAGLRYFHIKGFFGTHDVELDFSERALVVVGPNGIGKSTVASILYFTITRQWRKLVDLPFEAIVVESDNGEIAISKKEIEEFIATRPFERRFRMMADRLSREGMLDDFLSDRDLTPSRLDYFSKILKLPRTDILRSFRYIKDDPDLFMTRFVSVEKFIEEGMKAHILYLPTYRKIERDLKELIPELSENLRRLGMPDVKVGRRTDSLTEMVSFGMEDVEIAIQNILQSIKEYAREELQNLSGLYLHDIIRGEVEKFDMSEFSAEDTKNIETLLERVEEQQLDRGDKELLREQVTEIKNKASREGFEAKDKYLAYYVSQLTNVFSKIEERERSVRRFIEVCNRYLGSSKLFVYDNKNYTLSLSTLDQKPIKLRDLSSGEKQIVSIFAELILSEEKSYGIIIDEPELSLSVSWQKTLLPDMIAARNCAFLFSVTHSPFIFDNELRERTFDLRRISSPVLL